MIRLGNKYQHHAQATGCVCCTPELQLASRRLDAYSRRNFLKGATATALSGSAIASALAQASPPSQTLLRQVRLFDAKSDALQSNVQILIEGNKIGSIDATNSPPPTNATVIDCGNRVLMPGMIDAHWHTLFAAVPIATLLSGDLGFAFAVSTAEAGRTLQRGFTTVRDMGGPVFSFKQAIDAGVVPGPRIFPSGAMITTSGGHGDLRMLTEIPRQNGQLSNIERTGGAMIVDGESDLKLRIREQLLQGASQIKLVCGGGVSSPRSPLDMLTFSEDDLRAGVGVAKDWSTYVTVHAYSPNAIRRAISAGVACVEHAHLMDEDTARLFVEKNVWLSTQPFLTTDDSAPMTGPNAEKFQQVLAGTPKIYGYAKKYGIKTAWGSDLLFSPELTGRQGTMLTHLSRWYTSADVLRAATSTNAALLSLSAMRDPYGGKLGVIEKGALADLLLVNGNPLENIRLIEDPSNGLSVIMKDGQVYKNTLGAAANTVAPASKR